MFLRKLALAAALVLSPVAAPAATLLDTLSTNPDPASLAGPSANPGGIRFFNIAPGVNGSPLGQTFTLDAETRDLKVSAYLSTFGTSISVTARLLSGEGVLGTALASRAFSLAGTNRNTATLAMFDFAALGALASGTYTIAFQGTGALGGGTVNVLGPNQFEGVDTPGTVALNRRGIFDFATNPSRDFGIRVEGTPVVAAPEVIPLPATGVLLVGALGAFAALRARRAG